MRICLCIDKLGNGGAERVISILANQFSLLGHDVYLIETSTKKWNSFYNIEGSVKRIFLLDNLVNKGGLRKIKALRNSLKAIKPDVVISFKYQTNINVFLANMLLGIPHIVSERNNPYTYNIGKSSKLFKKAIFKKASGCVFQTEDAMRFYFKHHKKTNIIIANPIHLTYIPSEKERIRNKTILYVGRLDEQKNVKLLLDSFDRLSKLKKDYQLRLYGRGVLEKELKDYASSLQSSKNISFMGTSKTWHRDELNSLMFVMPSNYEGMPNSLMEAMALCIPCISTDCPIGGPRFLINNHCNGLLVPVNDVDAMTSAMIYMINNDKNRETMASNNNNMVNDFSETSIAGKWIDFIKEILRK